MTEPLAAAASAAGAVPGTVFSSCGGLACQSVEVSAFAHGPVLARVNALLQPGRVTAVLGPNGAGKSTLMGLLAGLASPRAGQVLLDGRALAAWNTQPLQPLAQRLAFMAQDTQVAFAFQAREVVEMGRYPHRRHPDPQETAIPDLAMQATGVDHLAGREVSTLSGGERARVHLARALAQVWRPPASGCTRWLLLDEPTAALDLQHQHHAMRLLRHCAEDDGMGVVAVLHDLNLALRYAHDVLLLPGGGQDAAHGPAHAVLTRERIANVWHVGSEMVHMRDGTAQCLFDAAAALQAAGDGPWRCGRASHAPGGA